MKKLILFTLVLSVQVYGQESPVLKRIQALYRSGRYNEIITILNSQNRPESIADKLEASRLYIFHGFSYLKMGKSYIAGAKIEESLKMFPGGKIDENRYGKEEVQFFNELKKENIGSLEITSLPGNVEIFIDGTYKGKTPIFIEEIFADAHTVTFIKNGFKMINEVKFVEPGKVNYLKNVLKWNGTYSFLISTEPQNADVFIDDEFKGRTTLILSNLISGRYSLLIKKGGFYDHGRIIQIPLEDQSILNVKLKKTRDYFLYSLLVPGMGQAMMKNYKHGLCSLGIVAGFLMYYNHFIDTEPLWVYRDKRFSKVINKESTGGPLAYKIDDKYVDFDTYSAELWNKSQEEKRIESFQNKKTKIQLAGVFVYLINLIDTWYLIHKNSGTDINFSVVQKNNYSGINLQVGF